MSENDLNIRIRAEDDASPVIERVHTQLNALARDFAKAFKNTNVGGNIAREAETFSRSQREAMGTLRSRFAFESRMRKQQAAEAKEAADAEKLFQGEAVTALRQRMAFSSRMYRQQTQEARDSAREQAQAARDLARQQAELARQVGRAARQAAQEQAQGAKEAARAARNAAREQAAAIRGQIAQARELERAQARAGQSLAGGFSQVRSGAARTVVAGAATAAVAGHEARRGLDALTKSGIGIDEALTQASIHVFGTLPASEARKAAETLRQRLMPVATKLGSSTADLIGAYVEASQAGVDSDILDKVTELGSKYAKMNKLSLPNTLEETGYALQGLKSFGSVNDKTVSDYFNHMSYLVATTAANREQMSAFGKRGLAAGASIGMTPDDTLAFGAAASAAGAQGNQAARMLSTTDKRVAGWSLKAHDIQRKHHRTDEDRLFLQAPGLLGYSSHDDMARAFRANPFDALVQSFERLKQITDPLKRLNLEKQLFGQEFGTFTDAMVMGGNLREYRERLRSKDADHFIDQNWSKQTGAFGFMVDQIRKTWTDLTDSLGLVLKPFYQDLRDYAVQVPAAFASFEDAFRASLSGFVSGLGSPDGTLAGLLREWFGNPAEFRVNAASWGSFFKGLGHGIRDIASAVRLTASLFGDGAGGMQTLGRLTGEFLALSTALVALSPVLVALSGFVTILKGFTAIGRGLAGLFRFGAVGEAGLAAGSFAGLGRLLTGSAILGIAGYLGSHRGEIVTAILDAMGAIWEAFKKDFRKRFTLKNFLDELTPAPLKRNQPIIPKPGEPGYGGNYFGTLGDTAGKVASWVGGVGSSVKHAFGLGGSGDASQGGTGSGSRSWRNNNPGNIKFGEYAKSVGATGQDDKGFAVFPDYATGRKAQEKLLFDSEGYRHKTLAGAIAKWAPASDGNDPNSYAADLAKAAGVDVGTRMETMTPEQRTAILDAMQKREGWKPGSVAGQIDNSIKGTANLMHGQYGAPGSHLTTITTPSGKKLTVHEAAAAAFKGFLGDLEASGYKIDSVAGYSNRSIRGSSKLSQHAYGNAIDINPGKNPMGYGPLKTDLPPNVSDMAAKWGLSWGGDWKNRKDAMHFEWAGKTPALDSKALAEGLAPKVSIPQAQDVSPSDMAASVGSPGARPGDDAMIQHHHHGPVTIQLGTPPDDPEATAKAVNKVLSQNMNRRAHDVAFNYA